MRERHPVRAGDRRGRATRRGSAGVGQGERGEAGAADGEEREQARHQPAERDGRDGTASGCERLSAAGEGAGTQSGVHVSGSSELDCRGVRITDCRFEGVGGGNGIRVEGATNDVEVRNNRPVQSRRRGAAGGRPDAAERVQDDHRTEHVPFREDGREDRPAARPGSGRHHHPQLLRRRGGRDRRRRERGDGDGQRPRRLLPNQGIATADEVPGVSVPAPPLDAADDKFLRPSGKLVLNGKGVGAE